MSSFVLSLVSPVLHKMVCGNFKESICKRICLDDVENGRFLKLVQLACGEIGVAAESVDELLDIGALAERLQMDRVRDQLENVMMKELSEGTCLELFRGSEANGLERLRAQCYIMLRDEFEAVSQQENFRMLNEETMGSLLEEDELAAEREENVFESLVRWITSGGEEYRGEGLLMKIRYGVVDNEYLSSNMLSALLGHEILKKLVGETLAKKRGGEVEVGWDGVERLCEKWMVARRMKERVIASDIFKRPNYVAIDSHRQVFVSDCKLQQVIVLNRDGSVVRRIGSQGAAAGQFNWPVGLAVDQQGGVVVSDCGNNRIQILNADGSVACCFGSPGTAVGQFRCPHGVAIDGNGHIVVVDRNNNRIQVFDADGSVVRHFGSQGAAVGQLKFPRGVAVDGAGRIVVADSGNHRVQVFDNDGSVALCFGSQGEGPGQLQRPWGVAVDREGRFFVADNGNNRVQVYNPDGSVSRVIDAAESGAGRLRWPRGVALGGAGSIVVVEGDDADVKPRVRVL